jgi:hypothetical protein
MPRFSLSWLPIVFAALALFPSALSAQTVVIADPYEAVVLTVPSPYWGYTYDPYGSPLRVAAEIVRSQEDYVVNRQLAALMREAVRVKKLEVRRAELDLWQWQRVFRAAEIEVQRQSVRVAELELGRKEPPLSEVLSANSLNALVDELKKQSPTALDKAAALDPELTRQIHLRSGAHGNIDLLKNDKLPWPPLLQGTDFAADRERVEKLLRQARQQVVNGKDAKKDVSELRRRLDSMQESLHKTSQTKGDNSAWTPSHYSAARRSLDELQAVVGILELPNAATYLNPPKFKTMAEMIQYMQKNGLTFAPGTTGSERNYLALQRALAAESARLHTSAGTKPRPR